MRLSLVILLGTLSDSAPVVEFGGFGRALVFVLIAVVPLLALFQPDDREIDLPSRRTLYASAALGVWILAGLVGAVLLIEKVPASRIGLHSTGIGSFVGWTLIAAVGTLAGNLLISRGVARLGIRESRLTYHLMPRSTSDRLAFLGVAGSAGLCEEISYHGFLIAGLAAWLSSGWWAAAVANLAFGVMHGYQGPAGLVRAFLMGYVLSLPVILGAGLWPAVAAHFVVDVLLGLGLWKWMLPADVREQVG